MTVNASVLVVIKVVGALYLLWLAFKAFRSALSPGEMAARRLEVTGGNSAYFRRGLIMQITHPKAALTWVAIMSFGVGAATPLWVGGSIVAGTTLVSIVGHLTYAVAFSTTPMVAAYRRARRWFETGLGAFFCFASYKLLTTRT